MTSPEQFARIEALFHELCDLDPAEREQRLAAIADDDTHVAEEVRRLLAHMPTGTTSELFPPDDPSRLIGERVGPYRVDSLLGEGGMGVVYAATQDEPVRRDVALKLIRRGADSREVVARFESERQALALMNHPNIARVYDAGAAADGRPYFAMELVRGETITRFCDTNRLDTRARLGLFVKVCDAVQHAHRRGVIHRDLKPSNVIVSVESGTAEPKVIDFGVAKATAHRLSKGTVFTRIGQLVGTPEYMSPEQADLDRRDIDTRSDVYALGVLLYELLSGQLPLDVGELRDAGLAEILRRIREVEPPKPSTRIRAVRGDSAAVARRRRSEPRSLARTLHGDLDWIVMRAIEKDRERRYGSVGEFATDIRNYLADRPVEAGPPSLTYRTRKFVRRHRILVVAAAAVAAALLLGVAGTAVALVRAVRAERIAELERDNAELRLDVAEQVSYFLVHLFQSTDPLENAPGELTVERLLERGVQRVDSDLQDQPNVRADVLRSLGRVYGGMGHYRKARELLERAVALRDGLETMRVEDFSRDLNELAIVHRRLGELELAAAGHRRALELLDQSALGDGLGYATHLNGLSIVHMQRREFSEAVPVLEQAIRIYGREGSPYELTALTNLGIVRGALGENEAAAETLRRSLELREQRNGPDNPLVAGVANSLANTLVNLDRFDEATTLYDRALKIWTDSLGPEHLNCARVHNNLGYMYHRQERWPEAVAAFRRALEIKSAIYGADHAQLVQALNNLGRACAKNGELDAAESYLTRGETIAADDERVPPATAFDNLEARAHLRLQQGRFDDAVQLFERVLGEAEKFSPGDVSELRQRLAEARRGAG